MLPHLARPLVLHLLGRVTEFCRNSCLISKQKQRGENFNTFLARLTAMADQANSSNPKPASILAASNSDLTTPLDYSYFAKRI